VLRFGGRPFPDVGLRGAPDTTTCEACHRDQRHQPRLVTGLLGGPTGPRWDGGPAGGLIELEVSSLGGVWTMPPLMVYAGSKMAVT